MSTVGLLLLAAGASSRMTGDRPKQLLSYEGRTLLRRAAETALASQCRPVVVVLGARADHLGQEISDLPLTVTVANRWEQGMGASLHAGLAAITDSALDLDGVVVILCDQPLLTADHLNKLIAAANSRPDTLIASEYSGTLGVPALFPDVLFPELQALPESMGAKPILQRHASQAVRIPFSDGALDIDTANDYQQLVARTDNE